MTDEADRPVVTTAERSLETLLATEPAIWRGREARLAPATLPSGFAALDAALPGGGWRVGGVTELLITRHGIGELTLLLPALGELTRDGRWAAFVRPPFVPYAPAFRNARVALERLLVVDCPDESEALWAAEQLLASARFAAVVLWLSGRTASSGTRRLQLATEACAAWTTLYRPARARHEHSAVEARIVVAVDGGRLRLEIVKARGGRVPRAVTIDPADFDRPQGSEWPVPPDGIAP